MTDSPTSQAIHLAMTELKERAERVAELEDVLRDCVEALTHLQDRLAVRVNPPTLERARSVLNKETNRG